MKNILLLILLVLAGLRSQGQSLVPTPFAYTNCAATTAPNGWTNCRVNVDCAASRCTPPAGYTGQAVMSFGESFSYNLGTALTIGQSYIVSMNVCVGILGTSSIIAGNHSFMVVGTTAAPTNCSGAYGSVCSTPGAFTLLSGTQNALAWQVFTDTIVATAAIQYITIGNCDNTGNGGNLFSNFSIVPYGITLTSGAGSDNQSVCPNTAINNITYSTPSATGATVSNLPSGVSSSFLNNVVTISGTPSTPGTYNYTITLTGGANSGLSTTGNITVKPVPVATATSPTQNLCSGNTTNIALSSNLSGTTYTWTAVQTGVTGASAGNGANIAQTLSTTGAVAGTVVYTISPTTNGCPGNTTTHTITVAPVKTSVRTVSICQGQSFSFNGITYTTSNNTAKDTFLTAQGCDSIVTLNLTVNPPITSTINASIYPGQSYNFGGTVYSTAQSGVQHTFTTGSGCDSIVTLYLTISPLNCQLNLSASDTSVCQGRQVKIKSTGALFPPNQVFNFNQNQLPSGWAISGTANFNANTCGPSLDNTPYFWASTATGTPNIVTGSMNVCSGGFLEFDMRYAIQGGASPCEGPDEQDEGVSLEYSLNGGTTWVEFLYYSPWGMVLPANPGGNASISGPTAFTTWNTYTVPIPAAALSGNTRFRWIQKFGSGSCCDNWGLDNIKILAGPCLSTTKVWSNGLTGVDSFMFTATRDTCFTLRMYDNNNVLLCSDSICITVKPATTSIKTVSICQGQSYTFNGINYTTSNNTAKDTLVNQYGCDSIITLNLTVNPAYTSTINPVICHGSTYNFGGTNYTTSQSGVVHTFQTAQGCDSIVTMNLTVSPALTGTQTTTICQGQSYTFNGITYTTGNNTAKDTLQNQYGCDSIVTLNLTVTTAITNTINPVICQGNSYSFGGTNYTSSQSGVVHTFQTTQGCDSIVTMNLTVSPPLTGIQNTTICQGQSYTFNGITYTTGNNTAKDTLQTAQGCDSIVTLNLTVTPALTHTINPVICQGNSYSFGGTNYTTSQTGVVHTFQTAQGCDSIVTMNLTVSPPLTGIQTTTICQGQSYTFNGITYTSSNNTAKDTLQNAQGCDSIVTLHLTVTPAITNTINPVICQGNSYTFAGTVYTSNQTGVVHTFQTAQGCDSIVTMNLTVTPPPTHTINPVICQGNSYNFGGTIYTTSQSGVLHTFQTAQGCDSIVTMNLTVSPPLTGIQTMVICQGQSYTFNGIVYTTSNNTAKDTVQNAQGCDSIVTLHLTVNPITYGTQTTVLCQGQSFTFNGITYTSSNYTAKDTLVNQYGCDSIVSLNLTINPVTSGTQSVVICQGHSYTFNGITYTASNTTARDTLVNQYGCDSILTLNLIVTPAPTTTLNDTICLGDSYTFGPYVYTTSQSGVVHNFPTAQGCDSMVTLNLTVLNIVPQPLLVQESGCDVVRFEGTDYTASTIFNDTLYSAFGCDSIYRRVEITVHETRAYVQKIDTMGCDEVYVNGIRYSANAQVRDTLRNQYGCDSVYRDFNIKVYQFKLELSMSPDDPYEMERIEFKTSSYYGNDYKVLSWSPASAFSDQNAKSQKASFTEPAQVIVRARSREGCEDEFRVDINPREYSKDVAVPNAFSPNGDGLNDMFRPILKLERAYNTIEFNIYNRYGQLVHATANLNNGWDGMHNGRPADNGVYSYKLVIYFLDGTNKVFSGEVNLVR